MNVNGQTEWEGSKTISDLTSTSIVSISGTLDRTDGTFLADTVAILYKDKFYAGGLITYVAPPVGTAQDFDLYVRDALPAGTGFTSGQISTIDLTGAEKCLIYWHQHLAVQFARTGRHFVQRAGDRLRDAVHEVGGGLTSLADLTSNPGNPLRVVGLVLQDPISGQPVFVARSVTELPN